MSLFKTKGKYNRPTVVQPVNKMRAVYPKGGFIPEGLRPTYLHYCVAL